MSLSVLYMVVIVPSAVIVPLWAALVKFQHLPRQLKLFAVYVCLNGLCNVTALIAGMVYKQNLPILHIYTFLEFLLISVYYRMIFENHSRLITAIMIAFVTLCIADAVFLQGIFVFNSYARSVAGIIITGYTLFYFKKCLDNNGPPGEWQKTYLFINTALLLYFGGAFFLFLLSNRVMSNMRLTTIIWNVHATLVLVMYILFTLGFINAKRAR